MSNVKPKPFSDYEMNEEELEKATGGSQSPSKCQFKDIPLTKQVDLGSPPWKRAPTGAGTRTRRAVSASSFSQVVSVRVMMAHHRPVPVRRSAVLGHRDVDLLRIDRRIVRHVIGVAEQQTQPVPAGRQRDLRLGLSGAEVQMVEVVRNRLVERRQI